MENGNAGALRDWLRQCPAIGGRAFGVDWLGDAPGSCALCTVSDEVKYRENIFGELAPRAWQAEDYVFAVRVLAGAELAPGLEALELLRTVGAWALEQSAAGNLPLWRGGRVTAIVPASSGATARVDGDGARCQLRLQVRYRVE